MANTLRSVGSIVAGYLGSLLGPASFGPIGAAIGMVLYNVIVPVKQQDTGGLGKGKSDSKTTAVDTALFQVFGRVERSGGECIRCAKDNDGVRSGIRVRTTSKKSGGSGGLPGGGGGGATVEEKQYLNATFALCEGPTFIDKVIESSDKLGERVIFDRTGTGDEEITMTDVLGAVSGDLVGQISETLRIYFGTEEQPIDSAEEEWYEDGVSADRGITKVVFNDYGPLEAGTTFRFWLRNDLTNRREIIEARLLRAGVPASRIDLRSIPEDLESYGWWCESVEPARQLAEEVAAFSIHDLHFMPVADADGEFVGMVFTDIARANPRYLTVADDAMGAWGNTNGAGEMPSSSAIHLQGGEAKPREMKINAKNQDKNFKDDGIVIMWPGASGEPQTVTMRTVCHMSELFDFGEVTMRELQSVDGTSDLSLMPDWCQAAPGCVLIVPEHSEAEPSGTRLLRVVGQKVSPEGVILNSLALYDPAAYAFVDTPPLDNTEPEPIAKPYGNPQIIFMDGASLSAEMAESFVMLVCGRVENGEAWGETWVELGFGVELPGSQTIVARGNCGELDTPYTFVGADEYAFDYDTTLQVTLDDGGSLASCSEDDVNNKGANVLWLAAPTVGNTRPGTYLAFTTATPTGLNTYEITGLMPGVGASDWDGIREIAAGARVVQITDELGERHPGVVAVAWTRWALNRDLDYEATNIINKSKKTFGTIKYTGNNVRVLPVNPMVGKEDDLLDGFTLHFFARSRIPEAADSYWNSEVPVLHLDPFTYHLELLDGSDVVEARTLTSTTSELTSYFTAAELAAIYPGGVPTPVAGRIRGWNDEIGDGFWSEFEV